MESKNGKATAAADQLVKEILQLSSSLAGNSSAAAMIPMSEYGTQNVKFAMHYDGPVESKNMTPAAQVHFDIDTFEAHNALANTAFQLHLGTAVQDNNRTVSITLHADSDVTERYDQLIAPLAADAYNNALQQQKTGPNASMVQTLSQLGTPQEVMATVLPKFHTFGKTTFDIDASAQGPDNTKAFFQQGKYTVNAFNWIAEPYGFKLAASVPNQLPFGDVTFTCITCDALINDMGDYGMRVEALVDKIPPGKQPYLSKNLIEGVKAFLHGISQNSLVIHVVMGNTGVTVSDKQIPEVMNIFATTVAPFIPKPQAPPPAAR
jgi:hypothetical protein